MTACTRRSETQLNSVIGSRTLIIALVNIRSAVRATDATGLHASCPPLIAIPALSRLARSRWLATCLSSPSGRRANRLCFRFHYPSPPIGWPRDRPVYIPLLLSQPCHLIALRAEICSKYGTVASPGPLPPPRHARVSIKALQALSIPSTAAYLPTNSFVIIELLTIKLLISARTYIQCLHSDEYFF